MRIEILAIVIALTIGLTEYWSKRVNLEHKPYTQKIVSTTAGVSITYILLELFPFFTEAAFSISKLLFITVLLGFVVHHIVEKEIYKHKKYHHLIKSLSLEENVFYFIHNVILGIVLVTIAHDGLAESLLFGFSVLAYTIISNLPAEPHLSKRKVIFLSSSTLLGTLFALFIWTNRMPFIELSLVGLATGFLLFTVTRHYIPFGRKGSPLFFTISSLIYSILIVLSWSL